MRVKVLGCGNLLSHDEGVGIHALRVLGEGILPPGVELIELGKPGVNFIEALKDGDAFIIIDAMARGEKPPGTVHRFEVNAGNMEKLLGSTIHGFNLLVPLKLLHRDRRSQAFPGITVLAMEIKERTLFGVGLSPEVKEGLEILLDMTWHELARLCPE
jgi:hydrogenase maturation protease